MKTLVGHTAHSWHAALALLALLMVVLLIHRPPKTDLTPPLLRAEMLPYFETHVSSCRGSLSLLPEAKLASTIL